MPAGFSSIPSVTVHKDSLGTASSCGLCQEAEALDGAVRFWACAVPAEDMTASVLLTIPGGGEGAGGTLSDLPVATEDTLGGIKASGSIVVDPDGTAHAVDAGEFASDEDVDKMLDGVFGVVK